MFSSVTNMRPRHTPPVYPSTAAAVITMMTPARRPLLKRIASINSRIHLPAGLRESRESKGKVNSTSTIVFMRAPFTRDVSSSQQLSPLHYCIIVILQPRQIIVEASCLVIPLLHTLAVHKTIYGGDDDSSHCKHGRSPRLGPTPSILKDVAGPNTPHEHRGCT